MQDIKSSWFKHILAYMFNLVVNSLITLATLMSITYSRGHTPHYLAGSGYPRGLLTSNLRFLDGCVASTDTSTTWSLAGGPCSDLHIYSAIQCGSPP